MYRFDITSTVPYPTILFQQFLSEESQQSRTTGRAITMWNRRMRERIAQGVVQRTVRGIIYPVVEGRARPTCFPVSHEYDIGSRIIGWVDDVDLDRWFPFGYRVERVHLFPGTDFPLYNDYSIITSRRERESPPNQTLRERWGSSSRPHSCSVLSHY
ncbi:hypothetical protein C8Q76DRAFT_695191 [Earliella scabrosa]|nr:hypothetical protein C8Q76DRAFT_695191 [Earliella scabrosa]